MTSRLERQATKALAAAQEAAAIADQKASILTKAQRTARDAKRFQNGELLERYGMRDVDGDVVRGISIEYQNDRDRIRWQRLGREARIREEKETALLPVPVIITLPLDAPAVAEITLRAAGFKRQPDGTWTRKFVLSDAQALAAQYGGEAKTLGEAEPAPISLAAE